MSEVGRWAEHAINRTHSDGEALLLYAWPGVDNPQDPAYDVAMLAAHSANFGYYHSLTSYLGDSGGKQAF